MTDINPPPALQLNPVTPDYAGAFNDIMTDLVAGGEWNDLSQAATGVTIVRWIASVSAFAQGSTARALQENYLDTARSPSGVFRAVRLQGVHIIRSRPGSVQVSVQRTDALATPMIIPALSQWTIGSQSFYNSDAITLAGTGATVSATLTRGQVQASSFTASGVAYQLYVLGDPGSWSVSDASPMAIDSTDTAWQGIRDGLWKQTGTARVFFESTLPDGTVECKFGDGTYGAIPPAGNITFLHVALATASATAGGLAAGATGSPVGFLALATTTAAASPNQDPPTPDFYKAVGPGGPANMGRAVTRDDHRAIALQYDGVVDALFQGQAELNPADLRFMNILAVTLLTTAPWTQIDWIRFKNYFEGQVTIATTTMIRRDPTAVPVAIVIDVAIFSSASVDTVTTLATQVVSTYFTPNDRSLAKKLEPSDLIVAIMESATYLQAPGESGELIDYINMRSPSGPITTLPTQYLTLKGDPIINVFYTDRGVSAAVSGAIVGL